MVKPLGFSGSVLERFPYYKNGTGIDISKNKQYAQNLQNNCAGMTSLNPYNSYNRPYPGQEASFGGSYLGRFPSNSFQFISLAGTAMAGAAVIMTLLNKGKVSPEILKLIEKNKIDCSALEAINTKISDMTDKMNLWGKASEKAKAAVNTVFGLSTYKEEVLDKPILEKIKLEATKRIIKHDIPRLENPTVWIPTSETLGTIKAGGLAEVPVQIAEAFNTKELNGGIKGEGVILTPLYSHNGVKKVDEMKMRLIDLADGTCLYKVPQSGEELILQKLCQLKIPVHNAGKITYEKSDIYTTKIKNTRFVFLSLGKRGDVTEGGKITPYANNGKSREEERFAFFSKAVHEFALHLKSLEENGKKLLADGTEADLAGISGRTDIINPPDAMIANDWQTGPAVALFRYMSQIKAKMKVISEESAEKLSNIPIAYVGHNFQHMGWIGGDESAPKDKILSLLFEKYMNSLRTVSNSHEMFKDSIIANTLYINGSVNFAHMGSSLADVVKPVSKNYAEEAASNEIFGKQLTPLFKLRKEQGTLRGTVNGNDKKDLIPTENLILKINDTLKLKDKTGSELKHYNESNVGEIKPDNTKVMLKYLTKVVQEYKDKIKAIKDVDLICPEYTNLEGVNDKTPVYVMVGRFEDQKGLDINANAIKKLYAELSKEHKEKPVFIMAGSGGKDTIEPDGTVKKGLLNGFLIPLKNDLKEDGNRIVILNGFIPDPDRDLFQLASHYFNIPSWFEPCGLVQMEAMAKGTLPIATKTGGLVDTIAKGTDGFITDEFYAVNAEVKDKTQEIEKNGTAFAKTLRKGYDLFTNDKAKYYEMVKKAMQNDFSWIIGNPKDKKGSFWEYMDALNIAY